MNIFKLKYKVKLGSIIKPSKTKLLMLVLFTTCWCGKLFAKESYTIQNYIDSTIHYWYIDIDKSNLYADSALSLVDTLKHSMHAECLKNKGVIHYFRQDFDTALIYYKKAEHKFTQSNDSVGLAKIYQNTGAIYAEQSKYEPAISNYKKAYEIAKALNDTVRIVNIVINWSNIYHQQGDFKKALELNENILTLVKKDNWIVYKTIGVGYLKVYKYDLAEKYLNMALSICTKQDNKNGLAILGTNMGELYLETNQYDKAISYFRKSIEVFEKLNYEYGLIYVYNGMGRSFMESGEYERAESYFNKGIAMTQSGKMYKEMAILYESIYENYLLKGNISEAAKYKKLKKQMQDSVYTEKYLNKMTDMDAKYKTLEKEQEIQKLSSEKTQQELQLKNERKNLLLAMAGLLFALALVIAWFLLNRAKQKQRQIELSRNKSDMENKLLRSQMNPHFMFNSLNSIQNYILKNDKMEACNYLSNFSDLMRNILQNSRLSLIPLDEELETLDKYLQLEQLRFKDKLSYSIKTDLGMDASEINIPPMILQPYIENAIIHGIAPKKEMGNISVFVEYDAKNSQLKCSISDNGIGRKAAANNKKPSHAKSLGMLVTSERLQQLQNETGLKAQVNIHDLLDGEKAMGTKVEVIIPIEKLNKTLC